MSEFHWTNGKTGRRRVCKQCCSGRAKELRKENPEKYRDLERGWHLRGKFGLSKKDYEALIVSQNNCCAICTKPFGEDTPHVDHSHSTGKVRGLLCFKCNTAIGKLDDNVETLQRAIRYLSAD